MASDPGPLLLERRVERGDDLFVRRVTADGEVWTRSHLVRRDEDGWPVERGTPEWELEARLPERVLEELREAVVRGGFFDLPPELRPDGAVMGAGDELWAASVGGRDHAVRLVAAGETDAPVLAELGDALELAVAQAGAGE
jgi:hypothetical protein